MQRMRHLLDRAIAFEVTNDDADGLWREERDAGELGTRQPRIGFEHDEHDELRHRDAELGERAFQCQARGSMRLPQEIAEIAGFAALALACGREPDCVRRGKRSVFCFASARSCR